MIRYVFREDEILTIKAKDRADPQKIGAALDEISTKAGGRLLPASVVAAAKDRKSVLHPHFEWDDAVAAEACRLDQARTLIRSIHVETDDTDSGYSRAYLSIKDKDGSAYRAIGEVLQSADMQAKVLAAAERDLLAFESRYKSLTDVCDLIRSGREMVTARRSSASRDRRASH